MEIGRAVKTENEEVIIMTQEDYVPDKTPIIDKCIGCDKVENGFCISYLFPDKKWRLCDCPLASHIVKKIEDKTKTRVGQQKQKKKK